MLYGESRYINERVRLGRSDLAETLEAGHLVRVIGKLVITRHCPLPLSIKARIQREYM